MKKAEDMGASPVVAEHATTHSKGEVVIYRTQDGRIALDVSLQSETVWLTQAQMVDLFQRNQSVVSRHIRNVFAEGELDAKSNMQKVHIALADKPVVFYNLDVIVSVGYRVKSKRGTQFRVWATQVLRNHLLKGYTVNERRLREQVARLQELQATVDLLGRVMQERQLVGIEAEGLLKVVTDYSLALSLLDQYDHQQLVIHDTTASASFELTHAAAKVAIAKMATQTGMGGLFGREKDESFQSSIGAIYQTFDGRELYSSIEEKAA